MKPKLTNARKAKEMMGHTNKSDRLDTQGLAVLLHNGTLPDEVSDILGKKGCGLLALAINALPAHTAECLADRTR